MRSLYYQVTRLFCVLSILTLPLSAFAQGNTCANAVNIGNLPYNTPFLNNPTTCGAGHNYDRTMRCGNYYMDGEEFMYEYTPAAGITCINVQLDAAIANLYVPTAIFITKGCPDDPNGECIAQFVNTTNDNAPKPSTLNNVNVTPGETYYIQVTARFDCYEFTLSVTEGNGCTPTPTGFDCNTAEVIPSLPHSTVNTTCGKSDYFKEGNYCSSTIYWDGPQYVMTYTPTTNECVKVTGTADDQTVRMSLNEGCPTYSSTNCDEVDYFYTWGVQTHYYTLTANTTYYFVFSTTGTAPGCSGYDISFSSVSSLGSVCADAISIDSAFTTIPFQTTRCKGDDYNSGDGCTSWYFADEEVIYSYESDGNECIAVTLNNMSSTGGLFMLDACPSNTAANCLEFAERISTWSQGPSIGIEYTITNPGTYYFMVGARSSWTSLDYDLIFNSSVIDPLGVVCETAHNLPSTTYISEPNLSTTCKANDYAPATSLCNVDLISGADYVLTYTAPETFCGTIVGKNTMGNGGIMLMDACPNSATGNCLGATACETSCDSIYLDFTFQAGQTYYIVLGAALGGNLFSCDLEIRKSYNTADGCVPCDGTSVECEECLNSDFETGTLLRWDGTYGNYNDPTQTNGLVTEYINAPFSRHTVMNAGGFDPVVGPALSTTSPEGGRYAVRLGNRNSGYQAETITYQVTVTPDNTMFMYYHAVVLQDPGTSHTPDQQPFFSINMTDENGDEVGCVKYEVRASDSDASFIDEGSFKWKDWSLAVVPLDPYIGQTIDITFTTKDCNQGGHFGYGYIDAFCGNIEIEPSNEVLCSGDPITLEAPVGFKSYLWNTGETTQSISVNTGGTYTVDVEGYGGACSATFTIFVDEFNYPTPDFSSPTLVCGTDEAIFNDLSFPNDTTNIISWRWDFGDGNTDTIQHPTHNYDTAGTYDVQLIVETSQGCEDTIAKQVKYSNPKLLIDSIYQPLCNGDSTGYMQLSADSGITPYIVKINGVDEGTMRFDSLPANSYLFNLKDDYGCASDTSFNIVQPDSLTLDTTITNVRCFKELNGKIEVSALGGTMPYQFNLDGMPFQTDSVFENLAADTFDIVVQDFNLCSKPLVVVVTEPDSLEFTYTTTHVNCYDDSTGQFAIAAIGGTQPYTYSNDSITFDTDSLIKNLKVGTYDIFTIDDSGCVAKMTQVITQPDSLAIQVYDIQPSSCATDDGSFKVSVSGGVQPYQFKIDATPYVNDSNFTGLSVGDHILTIIDDNNCGPYIQTVNIPALNEIFVDSVTDICDLVNSSSVITVTVSSGDPSTYVVNEIAPGDIGGTWISANVWESNPISSNVFYDFRFTDANGCNPKQVSGKLECECKADAGSFNYTDTVYFCAPTSETFDHNGDEFLEPDENLLFVIHDGSSFPLGNIIDQSSTPTFDLSNLNYQTTYYLVAIAGEDNGNGTDINMADVCLDYSEQVPFKTFPQLTFSASTNDNNVCAGDSVSIQLNLTGANPYTVNYDVNASSDSQTFTSTNHTITLPITGLTNVTFTQVDDIINSPCLLNPGDNFVFDVFPDVTVDSLNIACNNINTQYKVSFIIEDGTGGNYTVDGNASGSNYTSAWINNGNSYNFIVSDVNDCNPITLNGTHVCACTSDAGTMQAQGINACVTDSVKATHNANETLDGNDALKFIIHDSNSGIGNIFAWNSEPVFAFTAGMTVGTTYYITAVVGDDAGQTIDVNDPCLSTSGFVPVIFYDAPNATFNVPTAICDGDSAIVQITASGVMNNYSIDYSVNGNNQNQSITNGQTNISVPVNGNTNIAFTTISNANTPVCTTPLTNNYTINALDAPTAVVSNITCNNTATGYVIELSITGGDSTSYMVNGLASGSTFTSQEIQSGSNYMFNVTDANNCDTSVVSGTHTCPCITQLGTIDSTQSHLCEVDSLVITAPSAILDANDGLRYATADGNDIYSSNIIEWLSTPLINNTGLYNTAQTYYLFALAGDSINQNEIDLSNTCTQVSTPKPFEFVPLPDVNRPTDLDLCFNEPLQFDIEFYGNGPFELLIDENGCQTVINSADSVFSVNEVIMQNDLITFLTITSYGLATCTNTINYALPINMVDPIYTTFIIDSLPCHDSQDATVIPNITGGFGTYTTEWKQNDSTISTNNTLNNVGMGTYDFTATDMNGCSLDTFITVVAPPPFNIDYIEIVKELCYRDFKGKIYVDAPESVQNELTGGILSETTYDSLFIDLSFNTGSNNYTIVATNANGCVTSETITIDGLSPVKASLKGPTNLICPGDTSTLTALAWGGVGGYTYKWNTAYSDSALQVVSHTDVTYELIVADANGCEADPIIHDLEYFKPLEGKILNGPRKVCANESLTLYSEARQGDFNYYFNWTNENQEIIGNTNELSFTPAGAITLHLNITDGCGQAINDQIVLDVYDTLDIKIQPSNPLMFCGGERITFNSNISTTELNDCEWHFGDGGKMFNCKDKITHDYNRPGTYSITYRLTDKNNCKQEKYLENWIKINPQSEADFRISPDIVNEFDTYVSVIDQSKRAENTEWLLNNNPWSYNSILHLDTALEKYTIQQITTTEFNCNDTITKELIIKPVMRVFIPNSFTPNGDEFNSTFKPVVYNFDPTLYDFRIYDRWGEELFKSNDASKGWDGTYKGAMSKTGIYTYKLNIRSKYNNKIETFTGMVNLLK